MCMRPALLSFAALIVTASVGIAQQPAGSRPPAQTSDKSSVEDAGKKRALSSDDFSGEWRMFLPAGWERKVRIERLGEDRYYFHPPYGMKGTYDVRGKEMTRISQDRLEGDADHLPEEESTSKQDVESDLVWTFRGPYLLTLSTPTSDYRGAILFRSNGKEIQNGEAPKLRQ